MVNRLTYIIILLVLHYFCLEEDPDLSKVHGSIVIEMDTHSEHSLCSKNWQFEKTRKVLCSKKIILGINGIRIKLMNRSAEGPGR